MLVAVLNAPTWAVLLRMTLPILLYSVSSCVEFYLVLPCIDYSLDSQTSAWMPPFIASDEVGLSATKTHAVFLRLNFLSAIIKFLNA